jgi:hypothetical protein
MAESLYSGCYAVSAREVAAVRLGVGRGARHEIILRSGVRLPVPYAQATLLADKIWDGVWPGGTARRSRKKARTTAGRRDSGGTMRESILQTLMQPADAPGSTRTRTHHRTP